MDYQQTKLVLNKKKYNMRTKRILEQEVNQEKTVEPTTAKSTPTPITGTEIDLRQAVKLGCFTTYKWFTIDPAPQPRTTAGEKSVAIVTGKNNKNEQIFFYGNGTVKNNVSGNILRWTCDKLTEQTSSLLSKFGITKDDEEKVERYTKKLQEFIDKKFVSDVFAQWNKMLSVNFPNVGRLNITDTNKLPVDAAVLNNDYRLEQNLQVQFPEWNDVKIYKPNFETSLVASQSKVDLTDDNCKKLLTNYFISAIQVNAGLASPMDRTQISKYQNEIQRCWANNRYNSGSFTGITEKDISTLTKELSPFGFFKMGSSLKGGVLSFNNIKKILKGETKYVNRGNVEVRPYIFTIDERAKNESRLNNLDSLIKENLMISLNEKKKTILTENKIITNRLNVLLEGGIPKTKKGQEKFINEVINEAISLNSQGLDKDLIKENFWDTIKGLFGNYAGGGLVETFKEKFMKYLIGKLTPADPDGWTVGVIEKAFGNIPVSDYFNGKILECNYLTHILTKSIVEETIAKAGKSSAGQKIGGGSVIFDVLRNSIINQLDNTDFAKNIEHGLASFVCPAIQGISGKMEKAANQIKDKALKP